MPPTLRNAPYSISPETFGPNDWFVGSHKGCEAFRNNGKHYYEINLYSKLNDDEKKRRIKNLLNYISAHPEGTFYFSAIGCGRGHVDREIIVHLIHPLVWKRNVRLQAQFLTSLLKDEAYKGSLNNEHREALKAWHREYSASREMSKAPSFYNAATKYPEEIRNAIFDRVSDFHLKRELFNNRQNFKEFMTNLRDTLEKITKIPLPKCLEGNTYRYSDMSLGGYTHLYKNGYNKLSNSNPPVCHNLRNDLKVWVQDGNSYIFDMLDFLRIKTNDWSHDGNHTYYDSLPDEVLKSFKGFVIGFKAFLDKVYTIQKAFPKDNMPDSE